MGKFECCVLFKTRKKHSFGLEGFFPPYHFCNLHSTLFEPLRFSLNIKTSYLMWRQLIMLQFISFQTIENKTGNSNIGELCLSNF